MKTKRLKILLNLGHEWPTGYRQDEIHEVEEELANRMLAAHVAAEMPADDVGEKPHATAEPEASKRPARKSRKEVT